MEDDVLFGTTDADQFIAGGGNDMINGGAGDDVVVFASKYVDADIKISGKSIIVSTNGEGTDTLTNIETLRFSDQALSTKTLMRDLTPPSYSLVAQTGFAGIIGGSGYVIGTKGFQDVSITGRSGTVILDPSFNAGGDIVRLEGKAEAWTVQRTGSSAKLISETVTVTIPMGTKANWVIFADGIRSLVYRDGSFKIGDQSFSEAAVQISAVAESVLPAVSGANSEASARVILSPGAEISIGGKVQVIGTGSSKEYVEVISGKLSFDPSFNKGGDVIDLPGNPNNWAATRSGSSMVFTQDLDNIVIPLGTTGTDIAFDNDTRSLVYAGGQFKIGAQSIEGNGPTTLLG
jgi:Ca2+-binding RTX toxin-like protein